MQPVQGLRRSSCLEQCVHALAVAAARTHGADISQVQPERGLKQGDIELGIVRQDAHDGAGVEAPTGRLGFEITVRPVGDHLVCPRKTVLGGESGPRVTEGDVVTQKLPDRQQRCAKVVGPKNKHPCSRQSAFHEQSDGLRFFFFPGWGRQSLCGDPAINAALRGCQTDQACTAALEWFGAAFPGEPVVLPTQTANGASLRLAQRLGFRELEVFEEYGAEQWFGVWTGEVAGSPTV